MCGRECGDVFVRWKKKIGFHEEFAENTLYDEILNIKMYVLTAILQWSDFSDVLSSILSTDNATLLLEKQRGEKRKKKPKGI